MNSISGSFNVKNMVDLLKISNSILDKEIIQLGIRGKYSRLILSKDIASIHSFNSAGEMFEFSIQIDYEEFDSVLAQQPIYFNVNFLMSVLELAESEFVNFDISMSESNSIQMKLYKDKFEAEVQLLVLEKLLQRTIPKTGNSVSRVNLKTLDSYVNKLLIIQSDKQTLNTRDYACLIEFIGDSITLYGGDTNKQSRFYMIEDIGENIHKKQTILVLLNYLKSLTKINYDGLVDIYITNNGIVFKCKDFAYFCPVLNHEYYNVSIFESKDNLDIIFQLDTSQLNQYLKSIHTVAVHDQNFLGAVILSYDGKDMKIDYDGKSGKIQLSQKLDYWSEKSLEKFEKRFFWKSLWNMIRTVDDKHIKFYLSNNPQFFKLFFASSSRFDFISTVYNNKSN